MQPLERETLGSVLETVNNLFNVKQKRRNLVYPFDLSLAYISSTKLTSSIEETERTKTPSLQCIKTLSFIRGVKQLEINRKKSTG